MIRAIRIFLRVLGVIGLIVGITIAFEAFVTAKACRNAPAEVPYHDGMTICPGQSVSIQVPIPRRPVTQEDDSL